MPRSFIPSPTIQAMPNRERPISSSASSRITLSPMAGKRPGDSMTSRTRIELLDRMDIVFSVFLSELEAELVVGFGLSENRLQVLDVEHRVGVRERVVGIVVYFHEERVDSA